MADVWISRKRWTCRYCNVTINDDAPSRRHHESGLRHKNNVKQALQVLYRKGEQERKEAERAKREMDRIERLAAASYAKDQVKATAAQVSTSSVSSPIQALEAKPTQTPSWKPKNKFTAYGSVSIPGQDNSDVEAKRTSEKEKERQKIGQPGTWEPVDPTSAVASTSSLTDPQRIFPSDRQRVQAFRIREKVGWLDDNEDEQVADIKVKKRAKFFHSEADPDWKEEEKPKLNPDRSPLKLDLASSAAKEETTTLQSSPLPSNHAVSIGSNVPTKPESEAEGTPPEAGATPSGLFKKRKAGAGAGARKVKAFV